MPHLLSKTHTKVSLELFLDQIYGKDKSRYTFGDDLKVISLINQIEKN